MKSGQLRAMAFALIIGSITFGFTTITESHSGASGVVKQRMELMERYDELLDRLFAMVHGELPYSAEIVKKAANEIHETSGDHLVAMFPKGSTEKPSKADPAIWENMRMFNHMAERLEDFAEALEDSANDAPSGTAGLPKKWEDVPAMNRDMMGQGGGMMGQGGGMMMGSGRDFNMQGNTMEQSLWRVAQMCSNCHTQFRKDN